MKSPSRSIPAATLILLSAAGCGATSDSSGPASTAATPAATAETAALATGDPAAASCGGVAPGDPEADAVLAAFERYRAAALARDGAATVSLVDRRTVEIYDEYVSLARNVDREGLEGLDMMAKMIVLRSRHELGAKELAALGGREVFIMGIDKGWISDERVGKTEVASVMVEGSRAKLTTKLAPEVPLFFFAKEKEGWKLSLWKTAAILEGLLKRMVKEDGASSEEEWIGLMIDALSPRRFDRALLDGPRK